MLGEETLEPPKPLDERMPPSEAPEDLDGPEKAGELECPWRLLGRTGTLALE